MTAIKDEEHQARRCSGYLGEHLMESYPDLDRGMWEVKPKKEGGRLELRH